MKYCFSAIMMVRVKFVQLVATASLHYEMDKGYDRNIRPSE